MTDQVTTNRRSDDIRPVPDPTDLTTEALAREVASLKGLMELLVKGEETARLSATEVLVNTITLQEQLRAEKFNTVDEKFAAVAREMGLVESSRVEQKQDALASLAAALSAAKEAVRENTLSFEKRIDKSENATNDQLRQLGEKFDTAIEGVLRSLSDLKEREAMLEQSLATHVAAGSEKEKATDKIQPWVFAIIMAVVAVVSIVIQLSQ